MQDEQWELKDYWNLQKLKRFLMKTRIIEDKKVKRLAKNKKD